MKMKPQKKGDDRITLDPAILAGKPTIRGMRISVEQILRALSNGVSEQALLEDYPVLEEDDIRACLRYAADRIEDEKVFVLSHEDSH